MPGACLVTDGLGSILYANRAAGAFLNVSGKHLKDRQLLVFSADRQAFGTLMQRLPVAAANIERCCRCGPESANRRKPTSSWFRSRMANRDSGCGS